MVINNVQGIVISQIEFKETSKILVLLTRELGKISVIAQGALKKTSKISSFTNLFNIVEYDLNKGRNFYYLKEGNILESNSFLTKNIRTIAGGNLVAEMINKAIQDGSIESDIYDLTISFFINLKNDPENVDLRIISYILKFISFLGFQPDLTACIRCGRTRANIYYPSLDEGGLICDECRVGLGKTQVNRNEFILLNNLIYSKSEDIGNIKVKDSVNVKKLLAVSLDFFKEAFEIDSLNSEKWLERLNFI